MTDDLENYQRHKEKMKNKSRVREKIMQQATQEKGLLIVYTGAGKGKTTAAMGMVLRAIAHDMRVGIVQFIKGSRISGERCILTKFKDQVQIFNNGQGFSWETQDKAKDIVLAEQAFTKAEEFILDKTIDLVLLDELNIILRYGYLATEKVLAILNQRPFMKHVIITGRGAPKELITEADLVTEMQLVKHPFKAGIVAQKGIEF